MEIIGIDELKIETISKKKKEEDWVKNFRLDSYKKFINSTMPSFGPKIDLDFSKIIYYKSNERDESIKNDWNSVLKPVVDELDELGVLESEKHLGGMGVQYESEVIYHNMLDELQKKKVFLQRKNFLLQRKKILLQRKFSGGRSQKKEGSTALL